MGYVAHMTDLARRPASESAFWIDFDGARQAVKLLVDVACDEPDERPACVVITGDSGMGKTSILREAQRRIGLCFPASSDLGGARYTPVLRTVIPPNATSLKINLTLLWKQGWPITGKIHRIAELKVIELLHRQCTRLVAIDNVHAILTENGKARRDTLDAFRYLMSEGNVPMVVAGMKAAADIFAGDPELKSRSIFLHLKPWPPGERSQRLIRALAHGMRMADPDRFAEPDMAEFIWNYAQGITGEFKKLLHWAIKSAREEGRPQVEFEDLKIAAARLSGDLVY
jgi:Cdc6-like AAA superfamily ATPase